MIRFSVFASLILMLACQSPQERHDPGPELEKVFGLINQEVLQNSTAYETLGEAIAKIGHRLTGSENGKQAEEFAYQLLEKAGYDNIRYFPFKVKAWMRGHVSLWVRESADAEGYLDIPTVSLAHSPVSAEVEADLLELGNGLRKHFEAVKDLVPGKIVILNLQLDRSDSTDHNLHRTEKAALAIEYGAKGVIFVNSVNGNVLLTGAASVTGELIEIPAICIGKEDGADLRTLLQEGNSPRVSIVMDNKSQEIEARNIIASIEGREFPEERIVVGGHLDSWDLATGAIDNGIGSFSILEIARTFRKLDLQPRRSIDFVLFMGEEQGLLGSRAWVKDLVEKKEIGRIRYMINLDMTGNSDGFSGFGRTEMEGFIKDIGVKISAQDSVFDNKFNQHTGLHSDHQPFLLEGIPILGVISDLDPYVYRYYHSDGDDFELVNKSDMNNTARFTGMMIYALADAETLPAKRLSSEETRDLLIKNNLKEKLVLGKQWRWD